MRALLIGLLLFYNMTFGQESVNKKLLAESELLKEIVNSNQSIKFLNGVKLLPTPPKEMVVYYNKEEKQALSEKKFKLSKVDTSMYKRLHLKESYFYYTKYGSPLAFVAPLELLSSYNITVTNKTKVLDFGFGSIGQLLLMKEMGAKVSGIEVDPILKVLYKDHSKKLNLVYGLFPKDARTVRKLGKKYDLFISKNTLKKGFINPEKKVNPRFMIDLKVSHEKFLESIKQLLKPGGHVLIYNLHAALALDNYKPWTDGRSPYSKEFYEKNGFEVITLNGDHTNFARNMGTCFGWDKVMDFKKHLYATYTLLKKVKN